MTSTLDILNNKINSVNQDYVITLTKNNLDNIDQETKKICKILKFSQEWNFDDVLLYISKLDPKDYPNTFIFIIDISIIEDEFSVNMLKTFLINFGENRTLVLQLTWKSENKTKFYYKGENSSEFKNVKEQQNINSDNFNCFSSFLWLFVNSEINIEDVKEKKFNEIQNSSLVLKFLRILELQDEFVDDLVLKCAAEGSIYDLLAASNGYMNEKDDICGNEFKYYLCCEFNSTSVLMTAIQHSNQPIINFLIKNCSNLIQLLSFGHKFAISTTTFDTSKISILCDLLELADFPFPEIRNQTSINDATLQKIIDNRAKFHEYIRTENIAEIEKFENEHPNLKFAYNIDNKSALAQSLELKAFQAFFFLKSLRFQDQQIENIDENLKKKEKKKASQIASRQRRENIEISNYNKLNSVLILASKSIIYHRNKNNKFEEEQHKKIKEWLVDIYKTRYGCKLLDAAAQCEELKIVFDFECNSTNNADPTGSSEVKGSTYPVSKWIFIGAKYDENKEVEQEIKGVIAHEICHYVMRLVYQNNENPYYENDKYAKRKFEEVAAKIKTILDALKSDQSNDSNNDTDDSKIYVDGCGGIISSVYDLYKKEEHHLELIVRPVQLQVQFYDNKEKLEKFNEMFVMLFAFFDLFVIPDLEKFNLKQQESVKKFNNLAGLLAKIEELNLQFLKPKDLKDTMKNKITIVTTNAPKLLISNIYKRLRETTKNLFNVRNVFMTSSILENTYAYEFFKEIMNQDRQLNIILEFSRKFVRKIDIAESKHNFLFIISDENHQEELCKIMNIEESVCLKKTVNYDWMDLTDDSKINLLKTKVNFQNNITFSLLDLIQTPENDYDNFVDNKLLNLMTDKSPIILNQHYEGDISDKYVRIMFQSRSFLKIFHGEDLKTSAESEKNNHNNEKSERIEQEEMFDDSKNLKFVLIADKAGSGKSWILKTFTNKFKQVYPQRWITYVDLKQFINEFKSQSKTFEFTSFVADKILKLKTKYEAEIFKKLYKNGKVCILFDGFDEIAPDCADFVTKLFQSFRQNNGNQLWIATRDYFEVDLKEKLGLDAVYKIHKFTEENGANLIASSWLFDELSIKGENYNEIFHLKYSETLKKYKVMAKKLNEKIPKSQTDSIGLPQFYKMIADISSSNKDMAMDFTTLKIFEECVNIKYKVWSNDKGLLRSEANVKSQHLDLNYHKLHQLIAMESLFPEESEFGDLCREELKEWTEEEIIACGMLYKKFGKFLFSHETYREYYAAKFILNMLTKWQHHENACKYLLQFLTIKKFEIIRIFLNDALGDDKVSSRIVPNIQRIAKFIDNNIQAFENSSEIFEQKFQNLVEFVIKIFTYSSKKNLKNILMKNKKITLTAAKTSFLFIQIQNMILEYFNKTDLEFFFVADATLFEILIEIPDAETTTEFLNSLKIKTSSQFVSRALKTKNNKQENILCCLLKLNNSNISKFNNIFEILKQHLTADEIVDLAENNSNYGLKLLQVIFDTKHVEKMKYLWTELEKVNKSASRATNILICNIFRQKENFLQISAKSTKIELHEALWELLLTSFENRDELKDLIMQENKNGDNFVHYLVIYNEPEIIEFTITKIKENFNNEQYEEILKSKGQYGRNLLQLAARYSKDIKTHQILWKIFRDLCNSDGEFLEFLKKVDNQNNNVLHLAAFFTSNEILEFMINKVEKIASHKEIVNILRTLGLEKRNLLQSAARQNKSVELHEYLWTIMKKYLNSKEILDLINHCDVDCEILIHSVVAWNSQEIVQLTWNEIKKCIKSKEDQIKYLKTKGFKTRNLLQRAIDNTEHGEAVQSLIKNLASEYDIKYE